MNQYLYKCNIKTERRLLVRAGQAYAKRQRALHDYDLRNENTKVRNHASTLSNNYGAKKRNVCPIDTHGFDLEEIATTEDVNWSYPHVEYLRMLDPKHWKQQDHYKVLGLELQRYFFYYYYINY